jgi:hypothetical protein
MIRMASSNDTDWPWAGLSDELEAERLLAATYPSLHRHFKSFEEPLRDRFPQNIGRFWWEVRTCQYWSEFDNPKIVYQDITWLPKFCRDDKGMMVNSTIYFLPSVDPWLLSVLNSPAGWRYAFRTAQHGKDEALRYFTTFVESFPIPAPQAGAQEACDALVKSLVESTEEQQSACNDLMDWLRIQHEITILNTRLRDPTTLDSDAFISEVQKARGKKSPMTAAGLRSLRDEYVRTVEPTRLLLARAVQSEHQLHDLVNSAYGLSPQEVKLLWDTAPPRMPIPRPV